MKTKNLFYLFAVANFCVVMAGCEKPNAEQLIVGKWVTSDNHAGDNDTIVFKENFVVEKYFDYFTNEEISVLVTYSFSDDKIRFAINHEDLTGSGITYIPYSEKYEYTLKGNSLIIKGFSNPFSFTDEVRTDVKFTRVQ